MYVFFRPISLAHSSGFIKVPFPVTVLSVDISSCCTVSVLSNTDRKQSILHNNSVRDLVDNIYLKGQRVCNISYIINDFWGSLSEDLSSVAYPGVQVVHPGEKRFGYNIKTILGKIRENVGK